MAKVKGTLSKYREQSIGGGTVVRIISTAIGRKMSMTIRKKGRAIPINEMVAKKLEMEIYLPADTKIGRKKTKMLTVRQTDDGIVCYYHAPKSKPRSQKLDLGDLAIFGRDPEGVIVEAGKDLDVDGVFTLVVGHDLGISGIHGAVTVRENEDGEILIHVIDVSTNGSTIRFTADNKA